MIAPNRDCSERQLFVNNGFKNPLSNLKRFLQKGDRIKHELDMEINMPKKLGQYTKDNYGQQIRIGEDKTKPDFKVSKNDLLPSTNLKPLLAKTTKQTKAEHANQSEIINPKQFVSSIIDFESSLGKPDRKTTGQLHENSSSVLEESVLSKLSSPGVNYFEGGGKYQKRGSVQSSAAASTPATAATAGTAAPTTASKF